jgi:tetratricopeptide (TPR) repeat protein
VNRRPLAIAGLILCLSAGTARAEETEAREAAAALVTQAAAARRAGDATAAVALVQRALELSPGFSDALYLRGLINLTDRSTTRQALDDFRGAVSSARWYGNDSEEAALALAQTLIRTRRAAEAIVPLEALAARRPADPRPLAALAAAYRAESRMDAALAAYAQGRARFPRETAFVLGVTDMLAAAGRSDEAYALVDQAAADTPSDARLELRRAELEREGGRRLAAVERALAAGSRDPLAPVLALESRPTAAAARRFFDLFISGGGLTRADLAERAARAIAADTALAKELEGAMARYAGPRELDRDRDGFWEERWELAAGAIVRWTRDADQDGVPEYDAVLDEGRPVSLSYEPSRDARFTLRYGVYPWIDAVGETGPGGTRTWTLATRTLGAPFLGQPGPRVPTVDEVVRAAIRLEEPVAHGSGTRQVEMKDGLRVYLAEDLDGDGRFDHRLWYVDGRPARGERDLTGDGVFEAAETWADGVLARLSVDTDGDGRPDYGETYQPYARLWDYNEDGRDDSRETSDGKGGIVREFSTRADGRFDLRILFRGGAIEEVRKSGRLVVATPDAKRGVTWIGRVPETAAVTSSTPDGYRTFGGREYLVFRLASIVYVEALP